MVDLDALEKLNDLRKREVISEAEFQEQKAILMSQTPQGEKSQVAYVLWAFFLGIFGAHNFYAGRWKQGLAQLVVTVLTLFIGSLITYPWAIINIFVVNTDGEGNAFEPCPVLKYILGIIGVVQVVWMVGVIGIGGIAGYTLFMNRYRANEILAAAENVRMKIEEMNRSDADDILDKAAMVAVVAMSSNGGQGAEADMSLLVGVPLPNCIDNEQDIYSTPEGVVTLRVSPDCHEEAEEIREKAGNKFISDTDCDSAVGCVIRF